MVKSEEAHETKEVVVRVAEGQQGQEEPSLECEHLSTHWVQAKEAEWSTGNWHDSSQFSPWAAWVQSQLRGVHHHQDPGFQDEQDIAIPSECPFSVSNPIAISNMLGAGKLSRCMNMSVAFASRQWQQNLQRMWLQSYDQIGYIRTKISPKETMKQLLQGRRGQGLFWRRPWRNERFMPV